MDRKIETSTFYDVFLTRYPRMMCRKQKIYPKENVIYPKENVYESLIFQDDILCLVYPFKRIYRYQ